jgi:hypothetical protein
MRPLFWSDTQTLANGIAEDVFAFLGEMRVVAKARIEEIALETDAVCPYQI